MTKVFYFLVIFALIAMLIGGISLWLKYAEEAEEWLPGVEFEPPENYVFKDTPEGTIVENKNAGISFKVPENWTVDKKEIGIDQWVVNVLSPDAELNEAGLLIGGCGVGILIVYDNIMADSVRFRIENPERSSGEVSGGYEVLKISSYSALKMILENPEWGRGVAIKIPREDKIYIFETRFLPDETGKCSQAFEEFLKGISIE